MLTIFRACGLVWNPKFSIFFSVINFCTPVFTKCAENLENGRRLENFSWRLWYREAHFFDDPTTTASKPIAFGSKSPEEHAGSPAEVFSDFSSSVGSASDLEDDHRHAAGQSHDLITTPANDESHAVPQPCFGRRESSSRRQTVKHLSPESFKSLIESLEPPTAAAEKWKALKKAETAEEHSPPIKEPAVKEPPAPPAAPPAPKPAVPTDIPVMRARTLSDAAHDSPGNGSGRSLQRVSSSIVRGFTPENPSISRRLAPADPPQGRDTTVETRKKPKFYIGSSVSDSDEEDAPLALKPNIKPPNKSNISPPGMNRASSNGSVKKTHFHEIVDTKILPPPSAEESEDEDVDSAIVSDDDDDEWEDSQSDSGETQDDHLFDKREDTHLPSRGSMLSTLFKSKSDYNLSSQALKATNAFIRSRPSPGLTPGTQAVSPPEVSSIAAGIRIPQAPIASDDVFVPPIPASPRTTRRRMLASELSESLRRNLLWERQHRAMTNNNTTAALKRRHTSNDLARLKEFPRGLSARGANEIELGKYAFDSGDAVW